jgi:hypothetical protein
MTFLLSKLIQEKITQKQTTATDIWAPERDLRRNLITHKGKNRRKVKEGTSRKEK